MLSLRIAREVNADAIARLVNTAFLVEQFFIERDRTNPATVRSLMENGEFLLAEEAHSLVGCVYWELHGERGYFGMLSIEPENRQRAHGPSRALPPVGIRRFRNISI